MALIDPQYTRRPSPNIPQEQSNYFYFSQFFTIFNLLCIVILITHIQTEKYLKKGSDESLCFVTTGSGAGIYNQSLGNGGDKEEDDDKEE